MKRILLPTLLIVLLSFNTQAQVACTVSAPDATGVYPTTLADACENSVYSQDISFALVNDTCVFFGPPPCTNASFVSATITSISNLPSGLTYDCESADCIYTPDVGTHSKGCMRISGTPTTSGSVTATINFTVNYSGINFPYTYDVDITVNPAPTVNAGTDVDFCEGSGGLTLTATGSGTYSWSPTPGLSASNIASPTANPSSTTTYTVTVTDVNGCTDSDDIVVTVNPLPTASAGVDDDFCDGDAGVTLGATGGTSYAWSPTTGLSASNIAGPTATPTTTTNYTVIVTDANNCTDSDDVMITVNAPGVGGCVTSLDDNVSSISLNASPNPTSGIITLNKNISGVIFDIMGNSLLNIDNTNTVDLSTLSSGVYILNSDEGTIRITKD